MLRLCRAKYENREPPRTHSTKDTAESDRGHRGSALARPLPMFEQQSVPSQPQMAAQAAPQADCSKGELTAQAAPGAAPGGFASLDDFLNDCLASAPPALVPVPERAPAMYPAHLNPFTPSAPARKCAQDFDFDAFFDECLKA